MAWTQSNTNFERKLCRAKFYESRVAHINKEDPKAWWREMKRLCGGKACSGDLIYHMNVIEVENLSTQDLANPINKAFLESLEEYRLSWPITHLALEKDSPEFLEVSEERVWKVLPNLNPSKSVGPDRIPNWLLREHADLIAFPVCRILDASFRRQRLPRSWKFVDVIPLPKKKPVEILQKDLRPFSLTPCLSKVAEEFTVADYIKPAVLKDLDTNQYGAVPKSPTTLALLDMLYDWSKGTDGNSATIRPVLCDYRKAFDLIDRGIPIRKLCILNVPNSIVNWIIDFLSNRSQRIKLGGGFVSDWESVPSGVPQGTKLGRFFYYD